ncbi:acyl-CoA synthetase (AMP-forming)/AMP-acid ligase II [Streptomyces sp. Ag109_O5-1]|uniref:AMP-binding protein n=1 Tax=Streptomyces sp. Ag109_O5-1 TaxID=1938851 RepID=UPI000FB3A6A9|nr:AMP-binding protein [Streptomyces sp. Ag109_O5-1]RPE39953.1 acyl-CoA synthetase (AMP-forming)/AMP-acid ligase II [Streptomyces sp. Ag109_O5-1]
MTSQGPLVPTAYGWLRQHARRHPRRTAVTTWRDGAVRASTTFAELAALAEHCASVLRADGAAPGDRVLLVLPNDASFTAVFLAVVGAGLIAVPAPTPEASRPGAFRDRLLGMVQDCDPALLITTDGWHQEIRSLLDGRGARCAVRSWERAAAPGAPSRTVTHAQAHDIAFLQYTSGSTADPKGVAISHGALLASCGQAARTYRERYDDVAVTWVPLSHDMGLVTGVLRPMFTGYGSVLMPAREFACSPASWPAAVSACRGTLSSAPDFSYDLCVRRVPRAEADAFDLASWRVARNAGEFVRPGTLDRFAAHFGAAGFRRAALCPSYGMAEATLTVTASTPERPALRLEVLRRPLAEGAVVPVERGSAVDEPIASLLSSGIPVAGTRVAVAGAAEGAVGEILLRGPQLFSGYWQQRDAAPVRPSGGGEWHATGDRGFLYGDHLFVLGRADDVLVHRGKQFHPADVLAVCAAFPEINPGRCVVFATDPPRSGEGGRGSDVHLVAELRVSAPPAGLAGLLKRRLAGELDLYVAQVHFASRGSLPVTTSGKLRASEVARRFRAGTLPLPGRYADDTPAAPSHEKTPSKEYFDRNEMYQTTTSDAHAPGLPPS